VHEHHLIQNLIEAASQQVPAGRRAARITVSLSPDAHMDETSVRMHLETQTADTPLAGAELVVQPAPSRLFCQACNRIIDRQPDVFTCPACGRPGRPAPVSSGLRLVSVAVA